MLADVSNSVKKSKKREIEPDSAFLFLFQEALAAALDSLYQLICDTTSKSADIAGGFRQRLIGYSSRSSFHQTPQVCRTRVFCKPYLFVILEKAPDEID
jgi:hypothetical protein